MQPDLLVRAALLMIGAALFIALFRVIRGPTLPDRVVAVDLIGISSVCLMVLGATASNEPAFLDAAVVIALLGFLGTVAYARYAERKGGKRWPG
jgi:multicomponent Na+:H+ antiporter subunit F